MSVLSKIADFFSRKKVSDMNGLEGAVVFTSMLKNTPRIKEMAENYRKMEKSWLLSSMSSAQEKDSRLRFINTYKAELKAILFMAGAAGKNAPGKNHVLKELDKLGITELVKDYKAVYGPEKRLDVDSTAFIKHADESSLANSFRDSMKEQAGKSNIPDVTTEISEFQGFLYSKQDLGSSASGSVRPFLENFMGLSNERKLRVMYRLENNLMDGDITPEMLKDYKPDVKKVMTASQAPKWKFWKRISGSYMNFQKIKDCMAKEAAYEKKLKEAEKQGEDLAASGNEPAENETLEENGPKLSNRKRNNFDNVYNCVAIPSIVGSIGVGVASAIAPASAALKVASDGLGIGVSAIMVGKNIVDKCVVKNNLKILDNVSNDIAELKNRPSIKPEQRKAIEKLEANANTVRTIDKNKIKTMNADLVSNSISLVACVVSPEGSIPVMIVSGVVAGVVKSKISKRNTREVIDEKIFNKEGDFEKEKLKTLSQLNGKFLRLPKNLQDKYRKDMDKFRNNDEQIKESLRDEAVRSSGEVDVESLKNRFVYDVSESTYMILRDKAADKQKGVEPDEVDKKIEEIAESIMKAAGGKKIDFSSMDLTKEATEAEKQMVAGKMAERLNDLSLS